jgi:tetratricopeptide (TPR) repeat protein
MQQVIAERMINEGDLKAAIEHYQKALEINANLPGVRFELAEAILDSAPNDPLIQEQAQKELAAAIQSGGDTAQAECILARIAFRRSDFDGAYSHFSRAYALNAGNPEAEIGLGRLLTTKGKPEEALKYLRMAVSSDPLSEEAHYRLATVCRQLGLQAESEKELHLFQEIKEAKKRVRELYGQMNRKAPGREEQVPDSEP